MLHVVLSVVIALLQCLCVHADPVVLKCSREELNVCFIEDVVYDISASDVSQKFPGSLFQKNVTIVSNVHGRAQFLDVTNVLQINSTTIQTGKIMLTVQRILIDMTSVLSTLGLGMAKDSIMNGLGGAGGGSVGFGAPPYKTTDFFVQQGAPMIGTISEQTSYFSGGGSSTTNDESGFVIFGGGLILVRATDTVSLGGNIDSDGDSYVYELHFGTVKLGSRSCEMDGSVRQLAVCSIQLQPEGELVQDFTQHIWKSRTVLRSEGGLAFVKELSRHSRFQTLFSAYSPLEPAEPYVGGGGAGAIIIYGSDMQTDVGISCVGGSAGVGGGGSGGLVYLSFLLRPTVRVATTGGTSTTKGAPGYYVVSVQNDEVGSLSDLYCSNLLPSSISFFPIDMYMGNIELSQCSISFLNYANINHVFNMNTLKSANSLIGSTYIDLLTPGPLKIIASRITQTTSTITSVSLHIERMALLVVSLGSSIVCTENIFISSSTANLYGEIYTTGKNIDNTVIHIDGSYLTIGGTLHAGKLDLESKTVSISSKAGLTASYGFGQCPVPQFHVDVCDDTTTREEYPSIFINGDTFHMAQLSTITASSVALCMREASISGNMTVSAHGCYTNKNEGISGGVLVVVGKESLFLDSGLSADGMQMGSGGSLVVGTKEFFCSGVILLSAEGGTTPESFLGNGGSIEFNWLNDTDEHPRACDLQTQVSGAVPGEVNTMPPCEPGFSGIFCERCPPGTYSEGNTCMRCGQGEYQPQYGATKCEECRPGTFANEFGRAKCDPCPPGSISAGHAFKCHQCSLRSYAPDPGSTYCTPCPSDTIANMNHDQCLACVPGYFAESTHNQCSQCPEPLKHSHHYQPGCAIQCETGYFGSNCLLPVNQIASTLGGKWVLALVFSSLLVVILFPVCVRYVWGRNALFKQEHKDLHIANTATAQNDQVFGYAGLLKHRVYFLGSNSFNTPQVLPNYNVEQFSFISATTYSFLQQQLAVATCYRKWEHRQYCILQVQFLPWAYQWKRRLMQQVVAHQSNVASSLDSGLPDTALYVGVSPCHTLAWLDFVRTDDDSGTIAPPALPLLVHCAGDGTKFSPYQLSVNDPMVRSIQLYQGTNWLPFVTQLNTFLRPVPDFGINHPKYLKLALKYLTNITNTGGIGTGSHMPLNSVSVNLVLIEGESIMLPSLLVQNKELNMYNINSAPRLGVFISIKGSQLDEPSVASHTTTLHKRKSILHTDTQTVHKPQISSQPRMLSPDSPRRDSSPHYVVKPFGSNAKIYMDLMPSYMSLTAATTLNGASAADQEASAAIELMVSRREALPVCATSYTLIDEELSKPSVDRMRVASPSCLRFVMHATCYRNVRRSDTLNFSLAASVLFLLVTAYMVLTVTLNMSLFQVIPLYMVILLCLLPPFLPIVFPVLILYALSTRSIHASKLAAVTAVMAIFHSCVTVGITTYVHFLDESVALGPFALSMSVFTTTVLIAPTLQIFTAHLYYKTDILDSRVAYLYGKLLATTNDRNDIY